MYSMAMALMASRRVVGVLSWLYVERCASLGHWNKLVCGERKVYDNDWCLDQSVIPYDYVLKQLV